MKERLDEIARKRIESHEHIESPGLPEVKTPWLYRLLSGQSTVGKIAGIALDVVTIQLPMPLQRAIGVIRKKTRIDMPKPKPFLKQKSTWQGIASIAGAIGVYINPEAAVQIVTGVFTVIGGLQMWRKEPEGE